MIEVGDIYEGDFDTIEIIEIGVSNGLALIKDWKNGGKIKFFPESLISYYEYTGKWTKRQKIVKKIKTGHPLTKIFI